MATAKVIPISTYRTGPVNTLLADINSLVIGQQHVTKEIVNLINMHYAGLNEPNRPVGNVLLLGPTGTGKTRVVEALAEAMHNNRKAFIKVNCGEFTADHEVARIIGAPPGYLGHRETPPIITQAKLTGITTEHSSISIVLLDEIEKAAASFHRLLLGILDKGELRTGDAQVVNFDRSLIFMTSNLGAEELARQSVSWGLAPVTMDRAKAVTSATLAGKKKFSPEFWNRLDRVLVFNSLTPADIDCILELQLESLRKRIDNRFSLTIHPAARKHLIEVGYSPTYGARELKRTIQRLLTEPLADLVNSGQADGKTVDVKFTGDKLKFKIKG